MEPRWFSNWAGNPSNGMTFLGGTAKMDLWASVYGGDTRLVWGADAGRWHWPTEIAEGKLRLYSAVLTDPPTDEELDEAHTFLKVFAPWVLEDV